MWQNWVSSPGHLSLESDAVPTALPLCVCVCERESERERRGAYTVMSPVGNSTLKKMIVIFFLAQKLLHVRGQASIPFERLSRRFRKFCHAI